MGMSQSNKALLRQLDHELELTHEHELKKEMRIEQLKHQAQLASSPEERYWYLRKVLDEYSVYDSDSAQAYGREALSVAQALKRADLTNDIRLLNAYAMAAAGLLEQSRAQWEAVDTTVLDSLSYSTYLDQKVYQTTHENQYRDMMATPSKQAAKVKRTLQTLADTACPTHPDYWYYQAYNSLITGDSVPQVLAALEPVLATRAYDSRQDARLAWALSQIYASIGDEENHIRYLILSALADARTANHDIASIEELATILQKEGDLSRAYKYIENALQCAELLKNRVRVLHVATLQSEISKMYQEKVDRLQRQSRWLLYGLIGLVIVLIGAILYIWSQGRKLSLVNRELNGSNDELSKKVGQLTNAYMKLAENNEKLMFVTQQLQEANDSLAESDIVKVKCIGNIFSICSTYINRSNDFRKQVVRKLKAKQYEDTQALAASTELAQNELKDFYAQFDSIFLSIYPDFVADFNTLLPANEQIVIKQPDQLNTELRIFALVRLGITDSMKIATVLHCAPQTVYNKMLRIRNLSGLDKEQLLRRVKNLGHTHAD